MDLVSLRGALPVDPASRTCSVSGTRSLLVATGLPGQPVQPVSPLPDRRPRLPETPRDPDDRARLSSSKSCDLVGGASDRTLPRQEIGLWETRRRISDPDRNCEAQDMECKKIHTRHQECKGINGNTRKSPIRI